MQTIMDQEANKLLDANNLNESELKLLFNLLNKMDPDLMFSSIGMFGADDEDHMEHLMKTCPDKMFMQAISNFFSLFGSRVIGTAFGEDILTMCEEHHKEEFVEIPFIKFLHEEEAEMDRLNKIFTIVKDIMKL